MLINRFNEDIDYFDAGQRAAVIYSMLRGQLGEPFHPRLWRLSNEVDSLHLFIHVPEKLSKTSKGCFYYLDFGGIDYDVTMVDDAVAYETRTFSDLEAAHRCIKQAGRGRYAFDSDDLSIITERYLYAFPLYLIAKGRSKRGTLRRSEVLDFTP